MRLMSEARFREEIEKAITESHRQERIELEFKRIDDRIDTLMSQVEELHFVLRQASERKE